MTVDDTARPSPHLALIEILVAAADEMGHLREGIRTRTTVGQAQGIVMERLDLDAEQALEYLKRVSSHTNTRLVVLATDIVLTRELPGVSGARLRRSGEPPKDPQS